ncbi:MAG TPA: hypothetical protein VLX91_00765 [Candidatus Acidoferrales bacterium]|nr:hypothetical protein [Candidatus Acidoferrales bacterium]
MGIEVNIIAGPDKNSSSISASGSFQHVITDDEIKSFKLGDRALKEAVNAHFGKSPNDAYLRSPTPWDDLYKTYNWPEVQVVFVVQSAEVLGITSKPTIIKTQEFENKHPTKKATFNVNITEQVNNTTSSNWSHSNMFKVGQKLTYKAKFFATAEIGGETAIEYSHTWGEGGVESQSITVGSTAGMVVELGPGESILAELSASRGVLKTRIRYNAYLIGNTAVNYNPTYRDHHFWSLGIAGVMASGKIPNSIVSTEEIEVGYYSNAKITLKDGKTGKMKMARFVSDVSAD